MRRGQDQHGLQGVQNQYERVRGQGASRRNYAPARRACGDRARKEVRRHGYNRRSAAPAAGGGGALYWFKLRKPKADTRGADDLDDYDYGEDEEDEDYEFEAEDETDAGEDEEK